MPPGSQGVGGSCQQGTALVQSSSTPIVSHTMGLQYENNGLHKSSSSSMVYVGPELPWLPQRLVDKILAGDYVDFNDLPPARGICKPGRQFTIEDEMALSQSQQGPRRRPIANFCTWAQCFMLYTTVLVSHYPSKAADLAAYMFRTACHAKRFKWPSWVVYDQNFRQEMAGRPQESWAKVDSSIFSRSFLGMDCSAGGWCESCLSFDHECPLGPSPKRPRPASGPPKEEDPYCRNFNRNNGVCKFGAQCRYLHKCRRCNGDHPASACPSKKKQ